MINILNLDIFNKETRFWHCCKNLANLLQAKYFGPYIVKAKVCDLNYIVSTPHRRKNTQLCPINILKSYLNRDKKNVVQCANIVLPPSHKTVIMYGIHRIHRTLKIKFLVFRVSKTRTIFVTWTRNWNT